MTYGTTYEIYREIPQQTRLCGGSLRLAPIKVTVLCGLGTALLDECMTLWGEPERVYVQNVEQLHVSSECSIAETQATEYPKSTHREAGLAISMLHTGLSSAGTKNSHTDGWTA